jgi:hypothetical protein
MRGIRRLVPRGSKPEDPKVRGKPRTKGEEASHELPGVSNGDSEARANRELPELFIEGHQYGFSFGKDCNREEEVHRQRPHQWATTCFLS